MNKHITISIRAVENPESVRFYDDFEEFLADVRFWFSSGIPNTSEGGDEQHFLKIKEFLESFEYSNPEIKTLRSGLIFQFVRVWDN